MKRSCKRGEPRYYPTLTWLRRLMRLSIEHATVLSNRTSELHEKSVIAERPMRPRIMALFDILKGDYTFADLDGGIFSLQFSKRLTQFVGSYMGFEKFDQILRVKVGFGIGLAGA